MSSTDTICTAQSPRAIRHRGLHHFQTMTKATPFDAARSLTDEEAILRYLAQSFEAGDPASCQQALGNVARALGVKDIVRSAGMTRKAFERTLTDKHVGFDTIARIVGAMGYKLTVQRTTQPKASDIWQIAGARYTRKAGKLRVEFALGVRYHIPITRFPQFAALDRQPTARDLKAVKVSPKGRSVQFPRLGVKVRIADVRQAISGGSI
ncbi:addiction module antidote protein [Paraburkholderia tagetis]|uniref:Addiction module antidote protein n=1 Tax=Paraburkholderia tagetis TaxID=2913261 RepID=A0A9X1UJ17_9BURK|nr:putative addiction module antidote protein [Paraburkholderia tagetis]